MIRRPPRSTQSRSSAASDVYKRQGRPVRRVAMIHCVGSRQIDGIHEPKTGEPLHEYCSRTCCTATLQAANELKELFPGIEVFDLYRDIRTYGRGHEAYYENASRKGVLFFRYAPEESPTVERAAAESGYPVRVRVKDKLSWDEEIEMPVDLVVLAVGMVPRPARDLVEMLKLPVGSDGCGECVGACGYEGTIGFAEQAGLEGLRAEINGALCKGCGACVAACPKKAIELKGWTLEQFESMVDALVSDEVLAVEVAR